MNKKRTSGILAHITSLPSPYGIGDIGPASHHFIDFLAAAEQSCWQFLPTGPTNPFFDNSPYMSTSSFAGSFLLISPDLLYQAGLVSRSSLDHHPSFSPYWTDYQAAGDYKKLLLQEAYSSFKQQMTPEFIRFRENTTWLRDYAIFMTAKQLFDDLGWFAWPGGLASRNKDALQSIIDTALDTFNYYCFEQFEFYRQWKQLREYAEAKNIQLFGDLPIYVGHDSVDVWAKQDIFLLDRTTFQPTSVSGVPPDYFSETGQRWGNPLYDWHNEAPSVRSNIVDWWCNRLAHLFKQVDMVRIDHFRAFESYWSIPAEEETAINGKWLRGPGKPFFDQIFDKLGHLNIVAEDLGIISKEVEILRDALGFPGMKVLQFGFDFDVNNSFLPQNFDTTDCIVYTGTHDNDTSVGWFLSDKLNDQQRTLIRSYANKNLHDPQGIHQDMMFLAQSSISKLCIFPLQDVLGFGNDCKMNSPGVPAGNWRWRCAEEFLSPQIIQQLQESTRRFNRARAGSTDNQDLI